MKWLHQATTLVVKVAIPSAQGVDVNIDCRDSNLAKEPQFKGAMLIAQSLDLDEHTEINVRVHGRREARKLSVAGVILNGFADLGADVDSGGALLAHAQEAGACVEDGDQCDQ